MNIARNQEPRMLRHTRSNQAYVAIRDEHGKRRQVALGPWGSPESHRRYHEELARWHAHQRGDAVKVLPDPEPDVDLTINGAAARYILRNATYYRRPDGTPTGEATSIEVALKPLIELYGDEPLASLTRGRIERVRDRMIHGDPTVDADKRKGWCRLVANAAVRRLRGFVKWCAQKDYCSASVHAELAILAPLKEGRCDARESAGEKDPVPAADFEAALPFMPETVQAMARLQLLTACRPSEILAMRAGDIMERGGDWVWQPRWHKNAWRGKRHLRTIPLGPRAQAILLDRVKGRAPDRPVFSPEEAERLRWARKRQARETPRWPSHVAAQQHKHDATERRVLNEVYDYRTYSQAIARACRKAGVPVWSPGRLRHTAATRAEEIYGIEASAALCGHRRVETTQIYARGKLALATRLAKEIG